MDPSRHRAELRQPGLQLRERIAQRLRERRRRIPGELSLRRAEDQTERRQPLLCAVVEVAFQQPPRLVARLHDSRARLPHLMKLRLDLESKRLVLRREPPRFVETPPQGPLALDSLGDVLDGSVDAHRPAVLDHRLAPRLTPPNRAVGTHDPVRVLERLPGPPAVVHQIELGGAVLRVILASHRLDGGRDRLRHQPVQAEQLIGESDHVGLDVPAPRTDLRHRFDLLQELLGVTPPTFGVGKRARHDQQRVVKAIDEHPHRPDHAAERSRDGHGRDLGRPAPVLLVFAAARSLVEARLLDRRPPSRLADSQIVRGQPVGGLVGVHHPVVLVDHDDPVRQRVQCRRQRSFGQHQVR